METSRDFGIGALLADRYELQSVIGRGGTGTIFEALDRLLSVPVAVKVLHAVDGPQSRMLLERESAYTKLVDHPGIIRVFECGTAMFRGGMTYYVVMELLSGQTIDELLRRHPAGLEESEAVRILAGAAQALAAVHDSGVIHGDVKPSNIFACDDGRIKLLDFGSATADTSDTRAISSRGGSERYLSPSRLLGEPPMFMDDLFSFAVVAYEVCSGVYPWEDIAPAQRIRLLVEQPPPEWFAATRKPLPPALAKLLSLLVEPEEALGITDRWHRVEECLAEFDAGFAPPTFWHLVDRPVSWKMLALKSVIGGTVFLVAFNILLVLNAESQRMLVRSLALLPMSIGRVVGTALTPPALRRTILYNVGHSAIVNQDRALWRALTVYPAHVDALPPNQVPLMLSAARSSLLDFARDTPDFGESFSDLNFESKDKVLAVMIQRMLDRKGPSDPTVEIELDFFGKAPEAALYRWRNEFSIAHLFSFMAPPATYQELLKRVPGAASARGLRDMTPLHVAIYNSVSPEVVQILLDAGSPVNAVDERGETPLILAVRNGSTPVAQLLLERGANPNLAAQTGATPLMAAMVRTWPNLEIIELLLTHGVDVNQRQDSGKTALHHASGLTPESLAAAKRLIDAGANILAADVAGVTPVDTARAFGYRSLLRLYRQHLYTPWNGER